MTKVVLHSVLLGCGLAMLLLLAGFGCWQLGWVWLAGWSYTWAGNLLLLAFVTLLVLAGGLSLRAIYKELAAYFHREARAVRRVLMLQIRKHNARQRLLLEKRQLHYLSQLKRQRLLAANNKKHSRALFKAIAKELQVSVAPDSRKTLQKHLKQHYKQANPQAMLALRDQVLCRSSSAG